MPRILRDEFPDFRQIQTDLKQFLQVQAPALAANTALNFFKDSWRRQGFIDRSYSRWTPRKKPVPGRRLLVETARLSKSLRSRVSGMRVEIYTPVKYAQIHNEGGTITGTANVREHTRKTPKGKTSTVKAHTRKVNTTIPKRQYMGKSETLDKRLGFHFERAITSIIDKK